MENFITFNYSVVANNVYSDTALLPRSIVLLNDKEKGFCIAANCRKTDIYSVFRCLAKAVHAAKYETDRVNACEEMQQAGKTQANKLQRALTAHLVGVTDKNGQIMQHSIFSVRQSDNDETKLRDLFKINARKETLYKSLLNFGLDWNSIEINENLNCWVKATIKCMDYVKNLDSALHRAAETNESEQSEKAESQQSKQKAESEKAERPEVDEEKLKKCFTILGLKGNETTEEIKAAYREKAKETHPDKGGTKAKFQAVNSAFEYIKKSMNFAA